MRRHYVKFTLSGAIFTEPTSPIQIASRNIDKIKIPSTAVGYEIFDRIIDDKTHQASEKLDIEYFYIGKFIPTSQLQHNSLLHRHLQNNDSCGIIQCQGGFIVEAKEDMLEHVLSYEQVEEHNKSALSALGNHSDNSYIEDERE